MTKSRNRRGDSPAVTVGPALDWAVNQARAQAAIERQRALVQEIKFHSTDARQQIRKIKESFAAVTELRHWPKGGGKGPAP